MDIEATGSPSGGTFNLAPELLSGSTVATVGFANGDGPTTNPADLELTEPANPSGIGAPSPGGLQQVTVNWVLSGLTASDMFETPTFGMSCYYTTLQSDWGAAPKACLTTTISGKTYSGTVTNPPGLTGVYCSAFIAQLKLQGSAVLNSGQDIQYSTTTGKIVEVNAIDGADGTPVVAGKTVARDRAVISGKGVLVDLDQVGDNLLANDTGGAIVGYRIDLYNGAGKAVCASYDNIMAVGACTPATSGCPASAVN